MRPSTVLFLATSLALGSLHAQTLAPVPPGPPPPPPGVMQSRTPIQLTSTITRFLVNPNGEVDGLLLQDGHQVVTPPPLSSVVTSALHVGDMVRVSGDRVGTLPLIARAQISSASGDVIVQADPPPPPPPSTPPSAPALTPMTATGTVARPLLGPAGDVTGALLSDGTELRLPRPASPDVQNVMQPNRPIHVRGFGTQSRWGRSIQVTAIGSDAGNEQDIASPPPPPRL